MENQNNNNYFQKSFLKEYVNYENRKSETRKQFEEIKSKMFQNLPNNLKQEDKEVINFYIGCYLKKVIDLIADCPYLEITFNNFNGKISLTSKITPIINR